MSPRVAIRGLVVNALAFHNADGLQLAEKRCRQSKDLDSCHLIVAHLIVAR